MADLIFVAVMVAFFAIAAAFVAGCEHIIGAGSAYEKATEPSDPDPDTAEPDKPQELVA